MNDLFLHSNKLYTLSTKGPTTYPVQLAPRTVSTLPTVNYTGPKLKIHQLRQAVGFLTKVMEDTGGGEGQFHLYCLPAANELVLVPPYQTTTGGLDTTTVDLNDLTAEQLAHQNEIMAALHAVDPTNYIYGSGHSHGVASAFQSGTDVADERGIEGIHFTVGNLGEDKLSWHWRYSTGGKQGVFHNLDLSQVIEIPDMQLPECLRKDPVIMNRIIDLFLTNLEPDVDYDPWWDGRFSLETQRRVVYYANRGSYHPNSPTWFTQHAQSRRDLAEDYILQLSATEMATITELASYMQSNNLIVRDLVDVLNSQATHAHQ